MLNKIIKILTSTEFIFRCVATLLIIASINYNDLELYCLLVSGVTIGLYYGLYNDIIWDKEEKLASQVPYRAHQVWVHMIAGLVGSLALFFLINSLENTPINNVAKDISWGEIFLFILALLAYTGLLPRLIWYFSYAQQGLFPK